MQKSEHFGSRGKTENNLVEARPDHTSCKPDSFGVASSTLSPVHTRHVSGLWSCASLGAACIFKLPIRGATTNFYVARPVALPRHNMNPVAGGGCSE